VALLYHLGINGFLCRKDGGDLSDLIVSEVPKAFAGGSAAQRRAREVVFRAVCV
jgi:hypothetical protein